MNLDEYVVNSAMVQRAALILVMVYTYYMCVPYNIWTCCTKKNCLFIWNWNFTRWLLLAGNPVGETGHLSSNFQCSDQQNRRKTLTGRDWRQSHVSKQLFSHDLQQLLGMLSLPVFMCDRIPRLKPLWWKSCPYSLCGLLARNCIHRADPAFH